jgi:hypothetical protein
LDISEIRPEISGKFEMCCWRRMEEIFWTYFLKNIEILHRVKEKGNILRTIKEGKLTALVTACVETAF